MTGANLLHLCHFVLTVHCAGREGHAAANQLYHVTGKETPNGSPTGGPQDTDRLYSQHCEILSDNPKWLTLKYHPNKHVNV